jgi:murein L,D-transpeptidase YcbB/YkuD
LPVVLATAAPAIPAYAAGTNVPALGSALTAQVRGDLELTAFYHARANRPLWVENGRVRAEADQVLRLIENAQADGLDPRSYAPEELRRALAAAANGTPNDLARAEALLSRAVTAYARDLRRQPAAGITYVDPDLVPAALSPRATLTALATAPSLSAGLAQVTRMNPLYEDLRRSYADALRNGSLPREQQNRVRASLERLRGLPSDLGERFVLVNAASARLWMYEGRKAVGSMKVVVGRPGEETPMLAARIRHLSLNPYWNVPPDLVQRTIAPAVLKQGVGYLKSAGYEVLTDWSEGARIQDPREIDWQAVAAGHVELAVRQLPGPRNSMGDVKFMFPNPTGVYLHDTPNRELFAEQDRRRSAGCVRLEDAKRLATWLLGQAPQARSGRPEQKVPLTDRVPVYITYLTAMPEQGRIVFNNDHYGRDRPLLARLAGQNYASAD